MVVTMTMTMICIPTTDKRPAEVATSTRSSWAERGRRRRRLWRGALAAASAALIGGRAARAIDYSNDRCRLTNASFLTNDELVSSALLH
mmetsp:Transcript_24393/g.70383  ORF Transcript_24393/g.70383 Transcript_24393/m.70383 type:complete len:89 (-) Transcript_24393:221-487(-)